MFGIIIDAAPNGENNKVPVSSNVKLLQLFQRIQPSVYFIIISDESWRKKMTKGKSIPDTIKEVSMHMHQSKSILHVSEDIWALSLKNYLLQLGISSLDNIKGTSYSINRGESCAIIPLSRSVASSSCATINPSHRFLVSLAQLKNYPGTCIKAKASFNFLKT